MVIDINHIKNQLTIGKAKVLLITGYSVAEVAKQTNLDEEAVREIENTISFKVKK